MLADHAAIPVLAVTDMDRARAFYEGTLGLHQRGDEVPDGVVYRTSNGGFLVYPSALRRDQQGHRRSRSSCSGDAFDAEVAALRAAGIEFQTFDLPGEATWTDGVLTDGTDEGRLVRRPRRERPQRRDGPAERRGLRGRGEAPGGGRDDRRPLSAVGRRQSSSISEPSGAMTYQTSLTPWPVDVARRRVLRERVDRPAVDGDLLGAVGRR